MSTIRIAKDLWQCRFCLAWTPKREDQCRRCDRDRTFAEVRR